MIVQVAIGVILAALFLRFLPILLQTLKSAASPAIQALVFLFIVAIVGGVIAFLMWAVMTLGQEAPNFVSGFGVFAVALALLLCVMALWKRRNV